MSFVVVRPVWFVTCEKTVCVRFLTNFYSNNFPVYIFCLTKYSSFFVGSRISWLVCACFFSLSRFSFFGKLCNATSVVVLKRPFFCFCLVFFCVQKCSMSTEREREHHSECTWLWCVGRTDSICSVFVTHTHIHTEHIQHNIWNI